MKKVIFIIIVLSIFVSSAVFAVGRQQLAKGSPMTLKLDYDIGDVAISNSSTADFMITDSRREIYVNPLKEGVAAITVWDSDGIKKDVIPLEVVSSDVKQLADEATNAMSDTNVSVAVRGRSVYLDGEAESKSTLKLAEAYAQKHPEVVNNVEMSREVLGAIAGNVEKEIATPGVRARIVKGHLILDGVAYSTKSAEKAFSIAKMYDPDFTNLVDVKETGRRPGKDNLIKLSVYFMEVSKGALRSTGINWAPGATAKKSAPSTGGGLLSGVGDLVSSSVGFVFNLIPKIKFLRERGEARVLDHAEIMVKSGEAGDLFNGTQVPYYARENVIFKEVGIKVHAEPIASGENVDLNISANLSAVSANIEGGIDTKNIQTSAYIRSGQSLVLANVISNRDVKTYNRKPTDIDTSSALFDLALSKDFQTGRSEFVIFVLPEIVSDAPQAVERMAEYRELEEMMVKDRSKKEHKNFRRSKP